MPDTGERHQSRILFDGVDAEMSDDEWEISRSTENCRFDSPPPAAEEAQPVIPLAPSARTGAPTLPQIWIGDQYSGGCSELFAALENGSI